MHLIIQALPPHLSAGSRSAPEECPRLRDPNHNIRHSISPQIPRLQVMPSPAASAPRSRHPLCSAGSAPDNIVPCSHIRTGIPRLPLPGSAAAVRSGQIPGGSQFPRSHMCRLGHPPVFHIRLHRSLSSMPVYLLPACISQIPPPPGNSTDYPLSIPAGPNVSRPRSPRFCPFRCLPSPARFRPY